jgi:hypothetical protein
LNRAEVVREEKEGPLERLEDHVDDDAGED